MEKHKVVRKSHGVVKVTTSGQVTLPKIYRDQYDTDLFIYEIEGTALIVKPLQIVGAKSSGKYKIQDAPKFVFSSKDKKEKNLATKIDNVLYDPS